MQKCGESSSDPHPEYVDYGIDETEACSLLENEEPSLEIRKSCLDCLVLLYFPRFALPGSKAPYLAVCTGPPVDWYVDCPLPFCTVEIDRKSTVGGRLREKKKREKNLVPPCAALPLFPHAICRPRVKNRMWAIPSPHAGRRNKATGMSCAYCSVPGTVSYQDELGTPVPTDDESEYEIEYEVLSHGSDEEWSGYSDAVVTRMHNETADGINQVPKHNMSNIHEAEVETSSSTPAPSIPSVFPNTSASETGIVIHEPSAEINIVENLRGKQEGEISSEQKPGSNFEEQEELGSDVVNISNLDEDGHYGLDDLERLMFEIGNMRDNLRLMPDFQRKEMAANLAMKMAAMFGDVSDDEDGL
ncbi:hypothetical protein BHM03_00014827 [Ensete ventricosum]|uniref:Uncharacterized protein n=1 Tax=Ensete ventricosum TaxID=4639 RepID=A0A445ME99_ENSVE|nr:hypothetical protein BHM03_00014827 [Ensete ventricosum]